MNADEWNLRSTPVVLEGGAFWSVDGIDAVLRWNSATQSWEKVTDNSMEPLDALWMHATEDTNIGYLFEDGLSEPPTRQLNEQWNLVGTAIDLDTDSMDVGEAFSAAIYSEGNRALEVVVSPFQQSIEWFWQDSFVWIPQITEAGADPTNSGYQTVYNFGGYWIFMENEALLPGFTTTPLVINGDD